MAICKGCGAPVIWLPTVNGKMMCLDPKPIGYVEKPGARGKIFTQDGRVVSCEYTDAEGAETGYLPHWATCPNAADFKKGGRPLKRIRLCDACANLFEVAYTVKKIPTPYSKDGAASCENCGKRVVLLDTYELTLKGRE